jgi:cardiolipin synthase
MLATSYLTAANQLTFLRLLLVPVFALCMLYGMPGWALVTFGVAGATDVLDGLIARWSGQSTTLGAWLDPMADKILVVTMFVMLTMPGLGMAIRLPLWLTVLVISRDAAIVLTVAVFNLAVARQTFRPSPLGKTATAVYLLTGVLALYANYLGRALPIVDAAVYLSGALTLASGFHYLVIMTRRSGTW